MSQICRRCGEIINRGIVQHCFSCSHKFMDCNTGIKELEQQLKERDEAIKRMCDEFCYRKCESGSLKDAHPDCPLYKYWIIRPIPQTKKEKLLEYLQKNILQPGQVIQSNEPINVHHFAITNISNLSDEIFELLEIKE